MSNKLTDEQIAELAPDGCNFYCYKDGELFFHNVLGLGVFNSKCEPMDDDFLDSGEWKKSKPIPRKKFDISEYEFSDESVYYDRGAESLYLGSDDSEILLIKQDVIALAKHFNLTAEDLK